MKKRLLTTLTLVTLLLSLPSSVYAITEAEVESVGKEAAAGNVFIWVLCAVGFLKISQKIDSFYFRVRGKGFEGYLKQL